MNNKIYTISINKLHPFEKQPYKVLDNEEMDALVESIQENGVLTPLLVRGAENGEYEIISGHRRLHACEKVGLNKVPVIISDMSRDEAAIQLVDSNLHRENILPSEKAFAYKLKYDALSHQGTSRQVGTKLRTNEIMAENANDSARQIQRYIRLTHLIPELLEFVDKGKISLTPAVELSYLSEDEQNELQNAIESEDVTPSLSQAQRMKKLSQSGTLDKDAMFSIMTEIKANQRESVKISAERLHKVIPANYSNKQAEEFVIKACEYYTRFLQKQREHEER